MTKLTPKTFTIPALKGISAMTIEEHLKLYAGYVKNANLIFEKLDVYYKEAEANNYVMTELVRRFSFEYNGIRNHEVYFASLEGGAHTLPANSELKKKIVDDFGDFDGLVAGIKNLAATTRGIGWAVLWYDKKDDTLRIGWIDEQHLGVLNGCEMILGLDMWEHSFVADYQPSGKKQYVEDFFANLNWGVIEENFKKARA